MGAGGLYATEEGVRDVSGILNAILLADKATLGQISAKTKATNVKHEWVEDSLNPITFTASYATAGNTLTISAPTTTANVSKIVRQGALVFASGADFVLQFAGAPTTGANAGMTVYKGTHAAVASTTWYVVCLPYTDEAGLSEDIARPRTLRWNSTQIFERTMQVTKTRKGAEVYAIGTGEKDFKNNIKNRTLEAKRELNTSVLNGVPYYNGSAYTAVHDRRTMAGIITLIRDPDLDRTEEDTLVVDAGDADISMSLLDSLVYKVVNAGGLDESSRPCFIMHHKQKQKLGSLLEEIRRSSDSDKAVGYVVDKVQTKLGPQIPVIWDRFMRDDQVLLLDRSRVKLCTFRGDAWNLAKVETANSRMDSYQLSGQYTIELDNAEEAHGLIVDLSTS